MVALCFFRYNFISSYKSLQVTPAVAAGLSKSVWDMKDQVLIMEKRAPKRCRHIPYEMQAANSN